jgi:hypothetical protein
MAAETTDTRYNLLLTALHKSLTASRSSISTNASATITEAYGDVASFFASETDASGVETLVNLLMSRVDRVHERFVEDGDESQLEKLLREKDIEQLLKSVESSIEFVDQAEATFHEKEEEDRQSAAQAISNAKMSRISVSPSGRERKKRISPGEYIGYHAYELKKTHKDELEGELMVVQNENDAMEKELTDLWEEWKGRVKELEGVVGVLGEMSSDR